MAQQLRKVCVCFQSLSNPLRKKVVALPLPSVQSDLMLLKQILLTEMLFDESIKVLGGCKYTKIDDLVIFQFDELFEEEVELSSTSVLKHGDKNLVVKLMKKELLRQPQSSSHSPDMFEDNVESEEELTSLPTGNFATSTQLRNPNSESSQSSSDTQLSEGEETPQMFNSWDEGSQKIDDSQNLDFDEESSSATNEDNDCEKSISLPEEGNNPWNINSYLSNELKEGRVLKNLRQYVLVCAKHLMNTHPKRSSRKIYFEYSKLICAKYPCLMDSNGTWMSLHSKIVKCIRNQTDANKHKANRKMKRDQKRQVPAHRADLSKDSILMENANHDSISNASDEKAIQCKRDFEGRRTIVTVEGSCKTVLEIMEAIPLYSDFAIVFADFLLIPPMCETSKDFFKISLDSLSRDFVNFCKEKHKKSFPEGELGLLQLFLEINNLSSTKRGTKSEPVFRQRMVGQPVDVCDIGTYPHAVIFFSNDTVDSVLILGGGLNFRNVRCSSIWEAILQLIAAYYVFDIQYPACYGVLALVDKYCITKDSEHTENQTGSKSQKKGVKKPKKKQFQCLVNFLKEFNNFLVESVSQYVL